MPWIKIDFFCLFFFLNGFLRKCFQTGEGGGAAELLLIATPWLQYRPDGRYGALKFWRHWFWWHATTIASVSVPTCFGQHWVPLFSRHGVNYMTRVTLLPSFTSLDWRERHLPACSMLWFLPVTQCAGDAGGGHGHFRRMGCWDFYFVIWVVRWQWSGFVWILGSPPRPVLVF